MIYAAPKSLPAWFDRGLRQMLARASTRLCCAGVRMRCEAIMAEVRADKEAIDATVKDARFRADAALAANKSRRTERLAAIAYYDRRLAASEGER